jgi:putative membrane protein insertion efficiency factor
MTLRDRSISLTLRAYKVFVSPLLHALGGAGGACRFHPTCSEYAAGAIQEHGLLRGGAMALFRVLRCQPFCKGGYDPVPLRASTPQKAGDTSLPESRALRSAN